MQVGTKELYELLDRFEATAKHLPSHSLRFDRAEKDGWPRGDFYNHGETNAFFHAFRSGYSFGKATADTALRE